MRASNATNIFCFSLLLLLPPPHHQVIHAKDMSNLTLQWYYNHVTQRLVDAERNWARVEMDTGAKHSALRDEWLCKIEALRGEVLHLNALLKQQQQQAEVRVAVGVGEGCNARAHHAGNRRKSSTASKQRGWLLRTLNSTALLQQTHAPLSSGLPTTNHCVGLYTLPKPWH